MKVLILSHLYPSKSNPVYGIFVHQQTRQLVEEGIDVKVIAPVPYSPEILHFQEKWSNYAEIPYRETIDNVDVYHPRYIILPRKLLFGFSGYNYYFGVKGIVEEIYKDFKFDMIHAHVALPDGFAGIMLKDIYHCPLITTIHGDDVNNIVYRNRRCRENIVRVFQESDHIVANSERTKRKVNEFYKENDNNNDGVSVVYNGISSDKIKDVPGVQVRDGSGIQAKVGSRVQVNDSDLETVQGTGSGDKIVLTVGSLRKSKGIDYAIRAMSEVEKQYPDFKHLIIGQGPERQNLEQLAAELGISDKVEFLGSKSNDQVMEYMSNCELFLLPSWNEAFGMVYLEALACGKPIIGCKGQGVEEIIGDDSSLDDSFNDYSLDGSSGNSNKDGSSNTARAGFLVRPKDIIDIKEKVLCLLNDEHLAVEMGRTGQNRVLKEFTWEKTISDLIRVYQKVNR
ncbi:MAG: glycosyltransferase [bacterium]